MFEVEQEKFDLLDQMEALKSQHKEKEKLLR